MSHKPWLVFIPFLLFGIVALAVQPVTADSQAQVVYQTPTAQPDGRVVYIVQEGDTCLRIQLLTGTTIDELRTLNRLDQSCTIIPGKELLLAVITPQPSPTVDLNITPSPIPPTPTPFSGNGKVCVLLYDDINGNASRESNETAIPGGAVSISDRLGQVSKTGATLGGLDPLCEEIPEGSYNISMAIPNGYNATTNLNLPQINVQAGDLAILEFGAQVSSVVEATTTEPEPSNNGVLLAILGGLLIALGIGMGIYIVFSRRG